MLFHFASLAALRENNQTAELFGCPTNISYYAETFHRPDAAGL
jgi:hypothetical protein